MLSLPFLCSKNLPVFSFTDGKCGVKIVGPQTSSGGAASVELIFNKTPGGRREGGEGKTRRGMRWDAVTPRRVSPLSGQYFTRKT